VGAFEQKLLLRSPFLALMQLPKKFNQGILQARKHGTIPWLRLFCLADLSD
jgi:hypothetical protein